MTRNQQLNNSDLTVRDSPIKLNVRADPNGWRPDTYDEEARAVEVVAATENPVRVFDYDRFEIVEEVLLMSGFEAPESGRVPLLDSHQRSSVKDVLGSAADFEARDDGTLHAVVYFADTPDATDAAEKVRQGHLTDVSVGYKTIESSWIPAGETVAIEGREYSGPLKVTRRWQVRELSITPIGADEQAKARSAARGSEGGETMNKRLKELLVQRGLAPDATDQEAWNFLFGLSEDEQRELLGGDNQRSTGDNRSAQQDPTRSSNGASDAGDRDQVDPDQIRAEAQRIERERIIQITEACEIAGVSDRAADWIRQGLSVDHVRAEIFTLLKEQNKPLGSRIEVGIDEEDKYRSAAVDGLVLRTGFVLQDPAPGHEEFRGMSLRRLAEQCLQRQGINTRRLSDEEIARRAVIGSSTSDFPYILANTAGRVLRRAYEEYPSTYEVWCSIGDASDFKPMDRVQLSEAPDLELIDESGEYREGNFSDTREQFAVQKYGKMFSVSWEAIVNDDLGALTRIPRAFGAAARRKINDVVYSILTTNAAMSDGTALFDATHSNLASSGAAPSVSTLDAARAAMRKQKGPGGAVLNVTPRYILVPASLETATEVILRSAAYPEGNYNSATFNPFQNRLIPVVDARLDADSTDAWYLAADPAQIDTIEVAFLGNQRIPDLEEREGFEVDGRQYKVRIVFGAKAIDWRGLFKNPGA